MAELVQRSLDDMVAPLRDLLDRGIFSDEEIRAIVARRRESEYLLRRRVARKADFLRYIEAEITLERLRGLRTKRLSKRTERQKSNEHRHQRENEDDDDDNEKAIKKKTVPIGDVHIVRLIHLLFTRAIRKFRGDIELHLQHAEFAKYARSYNQLTRIYTEALQVHPREEKLWIEAASHEFFGHLEEESGKFYGGGEVQSARVLFQRGLRINPESQSLWVQYFCMEMHFIQKLRGRKEILMLEESKQIEDDPLFAAAPIPMVIFNNAIKAIPDDVAFRLQFLDLCRSFPQTEKVEAHITTSMERDFQDKAAAWIARAMYVAEKMGPADETTVAGFLPQGGSDTEIDEPSAKKQRMRSTDPVLKTLLEATEALPTAEMFVEAVRFLLGYADNYQHDKKEEVLSFIDDLFAICEGQDIVSTELALERVVIFESRSQTEKALEFITKYRDTQRCKDMRTLQCQLRLSLLLRDGGPQAVESLEGALGHLSMSDKGYMQVLLELFGALLHFCRNHDGKDDKSKYERKLKDIFHRMLLLAPGRIEAYGEQVFGIESVPAACERYVDQATDLAECRTIVDLVIRGSTILSPGRDWSAVDLESLAAFFDCALEHESLTKTLKKDKTARKRRKQLYETAIRLFGDSQPGLSDKYKRRRDEDIRFG